MWRQARRQLALAYWNAAEALLQLVGRRQPYGILKLEIAGDLAEQPQEPRLLGWPQRSHDDFFALLAVLRWAREDPALRAVFVRCGDLRAGWAKIQELRHSLGALRAAGKTVWVYAPALGLPEYVLASAAERICLAPAGTLDIAGLSSEVTFVTGTLEKLGVRAELVQMGKYKSAAESITRTEMSAAHREMVDSLLQDLYEQVVDAVAEGRRLDRQEVATLLDRGPFVAREAADACLVDALLYEDEAEDRLRAQCADAAVIERPDYSARRSRAVRREVLRRNRSSIAVLHLTGTVKMGESLAGPEPASATGAAAVTRDLKTLRERDDIAAVVLRVSSPGGSGLASDLIWHEVVRTRQRKPVVVSLGDVAASGGYFVSVAGKPVIAEGATITGSIGVLAGKALLRGLYDQLGVTKQVVTRGRHAALHSDYVPLGEEERQRLQAEAEFFYADFVQKVASGRELTVAAVDAAAQGRVWTGRQAQALGLVDALGGFELALEEAKVLAHMARDEMVAVERYPKARRLWKVSLNFNPAQARAASVGPWLRFLASERLWAVLPFRLRFY